MIAFLTPLAADGIGYAFGFVLVATNLAAALIVWFFLFESVGMSLEGSGENEGLTMVVVLTGPGGQVAPMADTVWQEYTGRELPEIVQEAIQAPSYGGDGGLRIPFEPQVVPA